MKLRQFLVTAACAGAIGASGLFFAARPAAAQGGGDGPITISVGDPGLITACSTTDYAQVAATALGITPVELRAELARGRTLEGIAGRRNVDVQTVLAALDTARDAEIDQAAADGLITAEQATLLKEANPSQGVMGGRGRGQRPYVIPMGGFMYHLSVPARNTVKPYIVASEALGVSCVELVKAAQQDQSMAEVAQARNVLLQTLVDALTKAYQDALAQDLEEGLIARVDAEEAQANVVNRVLSLVAQTGPHFGIGRLDGFGRGNFEFRFDFGPGKDNDGGQPGRGRGRMNPQTTQTPEAPQPTATPNT